LQEAERSRIHPETPGIIHFQVGEGNHTYQEKYQQRIDPINRQSLKKAYKKAEDYKEANGGENICGY
jgi:hypothetical protein